MSEAFAIVFSLMFLALCFAWLVILPTIGLLRVIGAI